MSCHQAVKLHVKHVLEIIIHIRGSVCRMQWHLEVWLQIETNQMPSLEPVFALSVLGEQVQSKGGKTLLKIHSFK